MQEPVPSSEEAAVLEHFRAGRIKLPEVSFRAVEPYLETQVVLDQVLPQRPALTVVGKLLNDVITDFSKS